MTFICWLCKLSSFTISTHFLAVTANHVALFISDGSLVSNNTLSGSCPPACERVEFGVSLSQLQFSDGAVSSMIQNQSAIQARYSNAFDAAMRVDTSSMVYYIGTVESLISSYNELQSSLAQNLINSATSTLKMLYEAIDTFTTDMQDDIAGFSDLLRKYEDIYNSGAAILVKSFVRKLDDFAARMVIINVNFDQCVLDANTSAAILQFQQDFEQFHEAVWQILSTSSLASWTVDEVTNPSGTSCNDVIQNFNNSLQSLITPGINETIDGSALTDILNNAMSLSGCEMQYGAFLANARAWLTSVSLNGSLQTPTVQLNIPPSTSLRNILLEYSTNKISTVTFAEMLMKFATNVTCIAANITAAMQEVDASFTNTASVYQTSVSDALSQLLSYLSTLSLYNADSKDFVNFGRNLKILMNPWPQLSISQVSEKKCWPLRLLR